MPSALFAALTVLMLTACTVWHPTDPTHPSREFTRFFDRLERDLATRGVPTTPLRAAYGSAKFSHGPAPLPHIVAAKNNQPEIRLSFVSYTTRLLTPPRLEAARLQYAAHQPKLKAQTARTGVPGSVMVALWSIESNFGTRQGTEPIIPALVTLVWEGRRAEFFKQELAAALRMVEASGLPPADLKGSWAGAMGHPQFMPSTYARHGTDGNGDGRIDIWSTPSDVLASMATFLQHEGWQAGQPWRHALKKQPDLAGVNINLRGLSDPLPAHAWQGRGVPKRILAKWPPPAQLRFYQPTPGGPMWLLGPNFDVILSWNRSSYFAFSVLQLADEIAAPLAAARKAE